MFHAQAKWLRDRAPLLAYPAIAVACILLVRVAVVANRPAATEVEESAPDAGSGKTSQVQLERTSLVAAAGIDIQPVQSRSVPSTITCNGSVSFNQNKYVKVPPKAEGILRKINVDVGSRVHAGDVLAVVASQPLAELKGSYIKAIVHEEHLRWQLKTYQELSESIARRNLLETQHLLEEQLVDSARIKQRLAEYGFSADQVDEMMGARDMGPQLPVIAPRDGVVVQRQAVEGEPVQTTTQLFALADLDSMWVHLNVYESDLPKIHLGQAVTFRPDGLPGHAFIGAVTWISPEVDPQTRTIQVRAEVANHDGMLRANMFGKGELLVEETKTRLVVPQAAVQSHHGNHVVFVQKPDNVFEVRQIAVGLKDDQFWEVTAGLKPGENVATTGSFLLKSNLENPDFGKVE